MVTSFLALVALVVLLVALASRYVRGRHRPSRLRGDVDSGPASGTGRGVAVSVYGTRCRGRRIEGYGLWIDGREVDLVKGDTVRVEGRPYTVRSIRRTNGGRGEGGMVVELGELP